MHSNTHAQRLQQSATGLRHRSGLAFVMLPTPMMRALPEKNNWLLLEDWPFRIKPDKDNTQGWDGPHIYVIRKGYEWDGASKPFHNSAIFVLPACHWKMVVPSLEHDIICDRRDEFAAMGVSSLHAARHFRRVMERYSVNDDGFLDVQQMYWAVRLGGPQWDVT